MLQRNKPVSKPDIPTTQPGTTSVDSAEGTTPFVRPPMANETPLNDPYEGSNPYAPLSESAAPNADPGWGAPNANFGTGLQFEKTAPIGTQQTSLSATTVSYRHGISKEPYYVNPGLYAEGASEHIEDPRMKCPHWLTPDEMKGYNINPNTHVHCWVGNPQLNHITHYYHGDRIREFMRQNPGSEPIRDANGCLIENGETVLCKKPWSTEDQRRHEYQSLKESHEYVGKLLPAGSGEEFQDPTNSVPLHRVNRMTEQQQREMAMADEAFNQEEGLIGKTEHLDWYEQMQTKEGAARAMKIEDQYRGVRMDNLTREQRAQLDALVDEKQKRRLELRSTRITFDDLPQPGRTAPKGPSVAVGNSGFPNPTQRRFAGAK